MRCSDALHDGSPLESTRLGRVFWLAAAGVAAIKAALLAADHAPNFLMGDSAAFIGTALTRWFPPQRSWTYGLFIRWFSLPMHSLEPLLIAQTLGGIGTCMILGFCLRRYFRVAPGVAAGVMLAGSVDPLQLLYERVVLPEAFSLTLLALVLACSLSYCQRPRLATLLVLQVLFAGLISLRLQFLLPVGILLLLLPFVGNAGVEGPTRTGRRGRPWIARAALHLLVSACLSMVLHSAYRAAMGIKNRQPPAYSYGTSGMVLSAFAPVLRPSDAPAGPLAAAIRDDAAYPLADRALRNEQLWNAGGLIDRLSKAGGGFYLADASENAIFRRMVKRDPVGVFLCGLRSYIDYWNIPAMPETLRSEHDTGPFDETFTGVLASNFHLDTRDYPRPALSKTLHGWLAPWLVLLLASPLLLLGTMLCAGRQRWRETSLLFAVSAVILSQNTMLSTMTVYRYLQPLTFATLFALGVIVQFVGERVPNTVISAPAAIRRPEEALF